MPAVQPVPLAMWSRTDGTIATERADTPPLPTSTVPFLRDPDFVHPPKLDTAAREAVVGEQASSISRGWAVLGTRWVYSYSRCER